MTSPTGPRPALDLRGAVDLNALAKRSTAEQRHGESGAAASSGVVIEVTDDSFAEAVVQQSLTVPVVLDFWATWCGPCKQLSPVLIKLVQEFGGRLLLATVDVDANPQLAQAFAVQTIPSVYAVVQGQPVPLFQGAQPEAQIRQVLDKLLEVAAANGVTGTVGSAAAAEPEQPEADDALPPHHQAAYDAIEADDLDAAVAAYQAALGEDPDDELARLGLAQTRLMQRTAGVDPVAARQRAADSPGDVEAQCLVADLDVLGGHVDDAFARLIDTVRDSAGDDRDRARHHLILLFDVVGDDPRVVLARGRLASVLF